MPANNWMCGECGKEAYYPRKKKESTDVKTGYCMDCRRKLYKFDFPSYAPAYSGKGRGRHVPEGGDFDPYKGMDVPSYLYEDEEDRFTNVDD